MIDKADIRILNLMNEKMSRLLDVINNHSKEEIEKDYLLSDTIQFEFEKLYEDTTRLSSEFKTYHPELPISDLRAIRNRVAHNYESVSIRILIDTISVDIKDFKHIVDEIISNN